MQDAVDLLHPLLTDTVDYVKQGALIATALVLMQQPESKVPCLTASVSRRHYQFMSTVSLPCFTCNALLPPVNTLWVLLLDSATPSSAVQMCMCR